MDDKGIFARIERLEKLAILTHGTLDVDQVKADLKEQSKKSKKSLKKLDDAMQKLEEMSKIRKIQHEKWKKKMDDLASERKQLMKTLKDL